MFDFETLFNEVAELVGAQLVSLTSDIENKNWLLTATYRIGPVDITHTIEDRFFLRKTHDQARMALVEDVLQRAKWHWEQNS